MAFHRSRTAQHMVGSRCSRCIHTHSTERPFSSSWHPVKSHTQMTWRSKGCFCHNLCVAADPPRLPAHCGASPLLQWSMCTACFVTCWGNTMIALPPSSKPTTCPLYLIFCFALSSAFLDLVSWHPGDSLWYFSFNACSNLCFFHRQNCPFPLGTVNVTTHCYGKLEAPEQHLSKYFSRQSCCSGKCPVTIYRCVFINREGLLHFLTLWYCLESILDTADKTCSLAMAGECHMWLEEWDICHCVT